MDHSSVNEFYDLKEDAQYEVVVGRIEGLYTVLGTALHMPILPRNVTHRYAVNHCTTLMRVVRMMKINA